MGLLDTLKLPPRPTPITPQPVMGITESQGVELGRKGARPIAVVPATAADGLRGQLDAKGKLLRDAYARLAAHQPQLEAAIAAAGGDTKKAMEAQKADVDKHIAAIQRQLAQIDADRRALDDPRTDAKAMNEILARSKSGTGVGKAVEIDRHDSELEKKWSTNRETTTTTSLAGGKATTRTTDRTDTVGLGGATRKTVESKETQTATDRTTTSVTRTDKLSKDGYATDTVSRREHTVDGKTSSIEKKSGFSVGPSGIAASDERTSTAADGSATSRATSSTLERGDGKLGVTRSSSTGRTDADGNETKNTTTTKGGVIAGKDGLGAYGEREQAFERKGANGLSTGAVAGLQANVVCNVKRIDGTPPSYDLSISINLGVSASLSAGKAQTAGDPEKMRDKGSGSVGASASGSMAVFMNRHYVLAEAEATAYVAALKAASAGGGGGTQQEFAIIRTGVSKGWDAAREAYLVASGKALDPKELARLRAGESVETGTKKKGGGGVSAGAGGIGVEGGYELGHDESTKVSRGRDGKLTYDTAQADSDRLSGGVKASVGAVEGGVSFSHANTTSTGYKIVIDPAAPDAAALQAALAACKSQRDLDEFAKKHPQAVQARTVGKGTADTQGASIGIGGAKAALGYGNSVDEQVTTDRDGKFQGKVVTGANRGGLDLSVGKLRVGDSGEEKAVAEIDADGNATVDVGTTHTSTDSVKFLKSLPGMGDKGDDKTGLVTKAAGGAEKDTDTKDVQGIKLKGADLKYLGGLACNDTGKWMSACPSPRMRDDWMKAGNSIRRAGGSQAAVAEALARFVGADAVGRADVVNALVRPAGDVSGGSRYEFPEALAPRKADYDALVIADADAALEALAKGPEGAAKAPAAGAELLDKLESLYRAVSQAKGFTQAAVQAEMLGAINARKARVRALLRRFAGGKPEQSGKAEAMDAYNDLLRTCSDFKHIEDDCFAQLVKLNQQTGEAVAIAKLIKQLRDLHAGWAPKYDELAGLAQQHGFGKDIYWKYKPDRARFDRAVKGAPGDATPAQPETADKRPKSAQAVADEETARQGFRDMQDESIKKMKQMAQQIPAVRARVLALSKTLEDLAEVNYQQAADKLFTEAKELYLSAEGMMKRCKPNHVPDMMAYGAPALEDYNKAAQLLAKGIALYPKAAPAKK